MKTDERILETAKMAARLALEGANARPGYLGTKAAAQYLGVSFQLLEYYRAKRIGPPYTKMDRLCLYKRTDLDKWMKARRVEK